ncbi:hypothetical protein SLS60_001477 [Paraconiothyrium brasiliense]|uniref:Uncharacterized protein n=1 Tax=Paraconiothyrium brasiliense TaxID=300254 RepID=A0ABR3S9A5_9PLEO
MTNLLVHYGPPHVNSDRNRKVENDFEKILQIYRKKSTLEFVGFTTDTKLGLESYRSVKTSLQADRLPKQFVIPAMLSPKPLAHAGGTVLKLSQDSGKQSGKSTRLFVRPLAPMDAVQAATKQENRMVKEAIIFDHPSSDRTGERWHALRESLGLTDISSLEKLTLHNCDTNMLAETALSANIRSLAFIDNQDYRDHRIVSPYDQGHVLDQLLAAQMKTPGTEGLTEFIHIQRAARPLTSYSIVSPGKLAHVVQSQPQLAVACLHQDSPYGGRVADFARPSQKIVSYRDSNDDIDESEWMEFAKKAHNVQAWGGNWSPITLVDHDIADDFPERAETLVVSRIDYSFRISANRCLQNALKPMKDLDTLALFTPALLQSYNEYDKHTEDIAVAHLMRTFDTVGLKIEWVHIVHRDVRTWVTWRSPNRQNRATFHAVRETGSAGPRVRAERVDQLPRNALETRSKLGADFIFTYDQYERQQLGDLHVNLQRLDDHTRVRKERRHKNEIKERKRKLLREMLERHGRKRGVGFYGAIDDVRGKNKSKRRKH